MIVPSVASIVKLTSIFDELGSIDEIKIVKTTQGRPALRILSKNSLYFYALSRELVRTAVLDASGLSIKLNDIVIESEGNELVLKTGGREFRGAGFVKVAGTCVYFAVFKRRRCVAGIFDVVDGLSRLYEVDTAELHPAELRSSAIGLGFGGFSISSKSLTLSISINGVELLPGFFRYIVSCPSGDYLLDRDGFLVRIKKGSLDVLGRTSEVISAACLSDGIVIADRDGLKVVRYGAYTTVLREAVRELSSHRDTISAISRAGLIKIMGSRISYTLDSPLLRSCESTTNGVACLSDDSVVFLDPAIPADVEVSLRDAGGDGELAELIVMPWFEGCRLSIAPRIVSLWEQSASDGTLRAKIYPKVLGWEGYVKVTVECPTYHRSIEEYVKFGKLELEKVIEKALVMTRSGRLLENRDHNCFGRVSLRLNSSFPLAVPIGAEITGVEEASTVLSRDTASFGINEVTVKFTGKCLKDREVLVKLVAGKELLEPEEVAAVYIDPGEFKVIDWSNRDEVEIFEAMSKSVIKAPGNYLKLYCLNRNTFEGYDYLLVENCEEPALLDLNKLVDVDGETFELVTSTLLRNTVQVCLQKNTDGKATSGGFYADCTKYTVTKKRLPYVKIDYGNHYTLAIYLDDSRLLESRLNPIHLVTGLTADLGIGKIGVDWKDIAQLATRTALSVGLYLGRLVYGSSSL